MAKSKKRKTSSRRSSGIRLASGSQFKQFGIKALGVVTGLAAATAANKYLNKTDINGQTVTGLSGETSGYVVPAVMAAAGAYGATSIVKSEFLRNACVGVAAAGGAAIANKITKRNLVSLNGDDEVYRPLPGIGYAPKTYTPLPSNNTIATTYNPSPYAQPIGAVGEMSSQSYIDANGDTWQYVNDGSDQAAAIHGLGEVEIL